MDVMDYLIDQEGKDWAELLSGWSILLPGSYTVWLVNRLGDVFAVFDDDSVHFLDVGRGVVERVADNRDHFADLLDVGDNAGGWLAIGIVDACLEAGLKLSPNQCYGFKIPPMLGGNYEVENLEPTDLSIHYSFLADIFRQTKDLPAGTKVRIVLEPEP
jgi:hypothetical protein